MDPQRDFPAQLPVSHVYRNPKADLVTAAGPHLSSVGLETPIGTRFGSGAGRIRTRGSPNRGHDGRHW